MDRTLERLLARQKDSGVSLSAPVLEVNAGHALVKALAKLVHEAGTIVWNGPVGVFEFDQFGEGTRTIANAIAETQARQAAEARIKAEEEAAACARIRAEAENRAQAAAAQRVVVDQHDAVLPLDPVEKGGAGDAAVLELDGWQAGPAARVLGRP